MITKYIKTLQLDFEDKKKAIVTLKKTCENCLLCELSKTRDIVVFGSGKEEAKIMIVGEPPREEEDLSGLPFNDRAGKFFLQLAEKAGFDIKKDLYLTNIIKCKTCENKEPKDVERQLCEDYLLAQIAIINPKIIVLCGKIPCQTFFDKKFLKENNFFDIRGNFYKSQGIIFAPVFSPSYLMSQPSEEIGMPRQLTLYDFQNIFKLAKT